MSPASGVKAGDRKGRSTILVIDDVPETLSLIAGLLDKRYRCKVAPNGPKGLAVAEKQAPDLILLDVSMPDMDGYEVCRRLKANPGTASIPVIFLTAMDGDDNETMGFAVGGVDYITKPVSRAVLNARVEAQLTLAESRRFLARKNEMLESMVLERTRQLSSIQDVIILAMASLAESKDSDNAHIRRVQSYTRTLALALRQNPAYRAALTDDIVDLLYKTSPLHDIGKVGVPDAVLFKPGRLTREEFDAVKRHSGYGSEALAEVERRLAAPAAFVTMAQEIALHHHERWDGTGYPMGLKGEEIPLSARVVALADCYDALISSKIYKPPYPPDEARRIIAQERGRQFDPAVVDAFFLCEYELRQTALSNPDSMAARSDALRFMMRGE